MPRSDDTHASTTDPDPRLYRKSHNTGAILSCQGHILMENRNGLVVRAVVSTADGKSERRTALAMLDTLPNQTPMPREALIYSVPWSGDGGWMKKCWKADGG